jgi:uncharacterized membrane protein
MTGGRSRRRPLGRATIAAHPEVAASDRVAGIDALRGGALCLMFAYHFSFDLRFYRVTSWDFEHDPFWLGFRALIVASFLLLVGVSLVLAEHARATPEHFWKRVGIVAACAAAASLASFVMFPRTFIYFGILHCIAVASILGRPLARRPAIALIAGGAVIAAGLTLQWPAFDARALSWIGFTTHKPATEDYVPLAPWAGVVFVGITVGRLLVRMAFRPLGPLAAAPAWLTWLGRHSLAVYMIHQPILLGMLWIIVSR